MAVLYEPSDRIEFILSDLPRNMGPFRIAFDGTAGNTLTIAIEQFGHTWSAEFLDVDHIDPFELIYRYDLLDLFDLYSIQNAVEFAHQERLLSGLCLLKEYAEVRVTESDRPGWRDFDEASPTVTGKVMVAVFEEGEIDQVGLAHFDAETGEWSGDWIGATHWLDEKGERLHALVPPVIAIPPVEEV